MLATEAANAGWQLAFLDQNSSPDDVKTVKEAIVSVLEKTDALLTTIEGKEIYEKMLPDQYNIRHILVDFPDPKLQELIRIARPVRDRLDQCVSEVDYSAGWAENYVAEKLQTSLGRLTELLTEIRA